MLKIHVVSGNFFYHGAWAPGKINVASPLQPKIVKWVCFLFCMSKLLETIGERVVFLFNTY